MASFTVRRLAAHEWREYRDLRLRALADSPDAFSRTLLEEQEYSDETWTARLASAADSNLPLVAGADGEFVGLAWGRIDTSERDVAHLYQMWVAPSHRRIGAGRRLLDTVIRWAKDAKVRWLDLGVTCGDTPAMKLYVRAGFKALGDPKPLRLGSTVLAQAMRLDLHPDGPARMIPEGWPYHENVPGPFYVVDGCCTACGVPEAIAPQMFASDSTLHCYVRQQPVWPDEIDRALKVIRVQELGCIRYRGSDDVILQRLADAGAMESCDFPSKGIPPVFRNVVTFTPSGTRTLSLKDFAADMRRRMPHLGVRTRGWRSSSLSIAWYKNHFHKLTLEPFGEGALRWVIRHEGPDSLSDGLHEWLCETVQATNVRWFSENELADGRPGKERPW